VVILLYSGARRCSSSSSRGANHLSHTTTRRRRSRRRRVDTGPCSSACRRSGSSSNSCGIACCRDGRRRRRFPGRRRALALLLPLVGYAPRLGLRVADLAEVDPHGASREGVGLRRVAALLVGRAQAADERVEGAPRLAQRARARRWRAGLAVVRAPGRVHLRLAELVQVLEELDDVRAAAPRQRQRRPVVPQVLQERVPVATLLRLVPAQLMRRRRRSVVRWRRFRLGQRLHHRLMLLLRVAAPRRRGGRPSGLPRRIHAQLN
jgi:hypothetical protein